MTLSRSTLSFLVIVILAACYPLFLGRFYAVGDMHDVFLPLEDFFQSELLAGRLPSWHPDIAWGFPVIASAQIGFFYPPLLLLRLLPLPVYLPLTVILHLLFLSFGTYMLARREGISHAGATLSATSTTLSAFVFGHITHLNMLLTLSWLPWQFLAMKRLAAAPKLGNGALSVLTLGLPFLAGHLHLPFLMALVSSTYYFWKSRTQIFRASGRLIVIAALTIAVAAVQLLPTLELVNFSSRGEGGEFSLERANQLSWPVYHLPTLIFPRFFGTDSAYWGKRLELEYGIFIGTIPLLLALGALRRTWRPYIFYVIVALMSLLLALGDMSPLRLLRLEPSLWYFSAPARWLLFYTLATSILAGAGLDTLIQQPQVLKRIIRLSLVILSSGVILFNLVIWNIPPGASPQVVTVLNENALLGERPINYYVTKIDTLIALMQSTSVSLTSLYTWLPLAALIALLLCLNYRRAPQILLAVATLELLIVAATTTPTVPWSTVLTPPSLIQALPADVQNKQSRILTLARGGDSGLWLTNPGSRPDTAERRARHEILVPASHALFNIAGTQWPASLDLQAHGEVLEPLTQNGNYSANVEIAEELNFGAIIFDPSIDVSTLPPELVASLPQANVLNLNPQPRAVLVTNELATALPYEPQTPTELSWTLDTTSASTLIVRDTHYPGWQATIDGQPTPISAYQTIFRQIAVPPGHHTISMTFKPQSLRWGLIITLTTLTTLMATAFSTSRESDRPYHPLSPGH